MEEKMKKITLFAIVGAIAMVLALGPTAIAGPKIEWKIKST
jgi:hypothetical protein